MTNFCCDRAARRAELENMPMCRVNDTGCGDTGCGQTGCACCAQLIELAEAQNDLLREILCTLRSMNETDGCCR